MGYVYFHKTTGDFQLAQEQYEELSWNDVYEVEGANRYQVYELQDGRPVLVATLNDDNPPPSPEEIALEGLRTARNERLAETDWWANSDLTMTAEQTAYRQALRDITDTYTSLDDVVWPTKP